MTGLCQHLTGPEYSDYISLIRTRHFGGISSSFLACVKRQLFPYKPFELLDPESKPTAALTVNLGISVRKSKHVPHHGNNLTNMNQWTAEEYRQIEQVMEQHARWVVDYGNQYIKSMACEGKTSNSNSVCDKCQAVSKDKSFQRSVRRVCLSIFSFQAVHFY